MGSNKRNVVQLNKKIRVFISSKCDNDDEAPKFEKIRQEIKQSIEHTGLADVYTFEDEKASSLSAENHFTLALADSDVCIFLIDNAIGVTEGVQKEVDIVKKYKTMALFYFCDEDKKEKTALEKSMKGSNYAKIQTVHSFDKLSEESVAALMQDIVNIYHYYCTKKLKLIDFSEHDEMQDISINNISKHQEQLLPKTILGNLDKSANYILKNATGLPDPYYKNDDIMTSNLDDWCCQFLPILFENNNIKLFNTSMFLNYIKTLQDDNYSKVVELRWQGIQSYFNGDIEDCIKYLQVALSVAKNTHQPSWIIKDILLDITNQHIEMFNSYGKYIKSEAQSELEDSKDELYYPMIDRFYETLQGKYIKELYKHKTKSPFSVKFGNSLSSYGHILASALIVAMFNGSLTYILDFNDKVKEFLFHLSNMYDDWPICKGLLKYSIIGGNRSDVKGIIDAYPNMLNNLSPIDAEEIMVFCENEPIYPKRIKRLLLAFGTVGYYLSDEKFELYESLLLDSIESWIGDNDKESVGDNIFNNLSDVSYRLSQDRIVKICCEMIDHHYARWYMNMFEYIDKSIDLNKMSRDNANDLIEHIIMLIENKDTVDQIKNRPNFLCTLRKENKELTEMLDATIKNYLPIYYNNEYKLETSENKMIDYPTLIKGYIDTIRSKNDEQGKNGTYHGYAVSEISTIENIFLQDDLEFEDDLMDDIIKVVSQTILESKETIMVKMNAVSLLCCILIKYPQAYNRNKTIYQDVYNNRDSISANEKYNLLSNLDGIALRISLSILFMSMEIDVHTDLIEYLPYLEDNDATTIMVTGFIAHYLDMSEQIILPQKTDAVILNNAFAWICTTNKTIRWNATRILLALLRNRDNHDIINRRIVTLIDSENVYIKNLILDNISRNSGITEETQKYALETCRYDTNYITRKLCSDIIANKKKR